LYYILMRKIMKERDEIFTLEVPKKLGTAFSELLTAWQERIPVNEVSPKVGLSELVTEVIKKSRIEGVKPLPLSRTVVKEFEKVCIPLKELIGASKVVVGGNGTYRDGDSFQIIAEIQKKNVVVADFRMSALDGCAAVCVFHHSNVNDKMRGMGIGTMLHVVRLNAAKRSGFALAQCTTLNNNEPQIKILENFGWCKNHQFFNPKTENTILMWSRNLSEPIPEYRPETLIDGEHEDVSDDMGVLQTS